jgi:hypothetical protein
MEHQGDRCIPVVSSGRKDQEWPVLLGASLVGIGHLVWRVLNWSIFTRNKKAQSRRHRKTQQRLSLVDIFPASDNDPFNRSHVAARWRFLFFSWQISLPFDPGLFDARLF